MSENPILGSSPLRKEGRSKVLGEAKYVDDLSLPGMWFGATVRSTVARAKVTKIAFSPDVDWSQFVVVTAADIPGENTIVHLTKDHPCLADGQVNHPEEPILLLAHPEKSALIAAVRGVQIDYEEQPGVFTIEESEAAVENKDASQIIWEGSNAGGTANCFKQYLMHSGDAKGNRGTVLQTHSKLLTLLSKASTALVHRSSCISKTTASSLNAIRTRSAT